VSPSSRIELAAGTITPSGDTLQIELIRPVGNPPAVLIISPAAPSVTNTNPKAIANVATAAVRVFGEAQADSQSSNF
jgi:hypothetical protein